MDELSIYTFIKQVDFPSILSDSIKQSSISTELHHIDTDGSDVSMIISIYFVAALSEDDIITLNSLMENYVNALPLQQKHLDDILSDMGFGMQLIAQFGAANRTANLSIPQVITISQQLAPIQSLLMSGSLETALTIIQNLTPNALISQDVINTYAQTIQTYLDSE